MSRYTDVIIAGFGGQGVLLMGNLLAQAAMEQGLNVTFIPVYGAEMRGGTANCTVVISGEEIGSPIIHSPHGLVLMNQPSAEKFQPRLVPGGIQVLNTNLVDGATPLRADVTTVRVPANDIARQAGNPKAANMAALGAYVAASNVLTPEAVTRAMAQALGRHKQLLQANLDAFCAGYAHGSADS